MTDSEITTTILRQIRDEIITTRTELKGEIGALRGELRETRAELKSEISVTNERLTIVEHTVEHAALQIGEFVQHIKTQQAGAIDDLRKRVTRLEKKVG